MYLKSEKSETLPDITLTELSGLQRIQYIEYLTQEEKKLSLQDIELSEMNMEFAALNIRASAYLVALSLYHTAPKSEGVTTNPLECVENIKDTVLSTWGLEVISANALQIRQLSGMLPKEGDVPADEDTDAEKEPVTAEKR